MVVAVNAVSASSDELLLIPEIRMNTERAELFRAHGSHARWSP